MRNQIFYTNFACRTNNGEYKMEYTINIRGQLLDLSHPQVMGILNVTPDSFYAGSRKQTEREIAERAVEIVSQGGSMIDIGAFSTRPGAQEVDEEEEGKRLQWALSIVRREVPDAIISVDTYRPSLARRCINDWGADIINDVSEGGLTGIVGVAIHEKERMFDVIGELKCPYILMSVKPSLPDMMLAFADEIQQLRDRGCKDIILDPGFGFGKTLEQNYAILADIDKLQVLELPILVGISRKSMIDKWIGGTPDTALAGTTALHAAAIMKGASILRVHDVKAASDTIAVTQKMLSYLKS